MHQLAGAVCVLFAGVLICDGLWKFSLLRGPYIYFWLYDLSEFLVLPTLAMAALHRATSLTPEDYGLSVELGWRDVLYVLPLPLFGLFATYVVVYAIADNALGHPKPDFSYITALKSLAHFGFSVPSTWPSQRVSGRAPGS